MKLDVVASSQNDEFYTPPHAIAPLLKYVPRQGTVWCPFDTECSHFVKMLRIHGLNVIVSHLNDGKNFFDFQPEHYDYVISNPPYSLKTEVFQRLFALNKPFAMLVGVVGLFESKRRFSMFKDNDFDIMYFDKRIAYFKSYDEQKPSLNPPFSSVYVTRGLLPNKIVFECVGPVRQAYPWELVK